MDFTVQRLWLTPRSACGDITVGTLSLFSLELPVKDGLPGSAIPPGRYQVKFQPSPKFMASTDPWVKQYAPWMPHIVGIPGRSLIMFHWGNDAENTEGCIIVGSTHDDDFVGGSREAFAKFYEAIAPSVLFNECWVNVQGASPKCQTTEKTFKTLPPDNDDAQKDCHESLRKIPLRKTDQTG